MTSSEDDMKKALLKMFQCFSVTGNDTERRLKFEAYWEVLGDLPPAAIVSVCRDACRGYLGQPSFMPTAAELYQAARRLLGAHISRAHELFPTVELESQIQPEEQARVAQGLKELVSELALNKSMEPPWAK